jgi:pantoate--beta-alanine ligase
VRKTGFVAERRLMLPVETSVQPSLRDGLQGGVSPWTEVHGYAQESLCGSVRNNTLHRTSYLALSIASRDTGQAVSPNVNPFGLCSCQLDGAVALFGFMQIVSSIVAMQRLALRWRRQGIRIGFVPTMGFLHAGHLSLVKHARKLVGKRGKVVLSIYVNPTQFGPKEDFSKYPRDLKRDLKLCRVEGVDVVFTPSDVEMYPGRGKQKAESRKRKAESDLYSTYVVEESLSQSMEGASRPTHFRGVTTIVAKLFNIVLPDAAVFGAKDFQQAAIIQRMAKDLNFPLEVVVAPTLREADGLAMSSRNKYLEGDLRTQAVVLWRSIQKAQATVKKCAVSATKLKAELKKLIEVEPAARLDYIEFFDPETLVPVTKVTRGTQMALAVFVGKTRLIDNARL